MRFVEISALCALTCTGCTMAMADPEGPGRSQTPASRDCVCEQPWEFEIGAYPEPRLTLLHQGYEVTSHGNAESPLGFDPDPTLLQWVSELRGGAHFLAAHGDNDRILIEVYPPTAAGEDYADSVCASYVLQHGFTIQELSVVYPTSGNGCAIALSWAGVKARCAFNDAIVDFECCCSSALNTPPVSLNGARVMLVNSCGVSPVESHQNVSAFWPCLDGEHTNDCPDCWKYRTIRWAKTYGITYFTVVPLVSGGLFTTLAPFVKWISAEAYSQVPEEMELTIMTDTEVQTVLGAGQAFDIEGGGSPPHGPTIQILSACQNTDTTFTVTVEPIYGELHGTSSLHALYHQISSKKLVDIPLDGDGYGGTAPDDWIWPLKHGQDPAASVAAFSVDEYGTARFDVERRWHTERFEVWGLRGDEHDVVGASEARVGHHELAVGTNHALYQLVEIETNGRIMDHGVVAPRERVEAVADPHPTSEELYARLDSLFATHGAAGPGKRTSIPGNRLDILAAPHFVTAAGYHADYRIWHDQIEVVVIDVGQFGADPEAIEAGIQSYIATSPSQLFLLVGDAHSRLWTDATLWSQNGWARVKTDYLSAGYPAAGNPERQDIPVGEVPDPLPANMNMGYFEPYWYKGDGPHYCQSDCPEKVVARLPFHYDEQDQDWQYLSYISKLQWYDNGPVGGDAYSALICVGDVDLYFGDGSGAYAMSVANEVAAALPVGTEYELLLQSDHVSNHERMHATVDRWNHGIDLVYFASSRGTRYDAGHFLSLAEGFNPSLLWVGSWPCWVIGTTCDVGAEFRTMATQTAASGETVLLRLLQEPARGAIGGIVPASGTWQSGNKLLASRTTEKIFEDPSRPVMESFRLAQCEVLSELDPVADGDAYDAILSYFLYGDPCLPLRIQAYSTDAPETPPPPCALELRASSPNPVRESTSIRFGLAHPGPIRIEIYDSAGRLVRTLLDAAMAPGQYRIQWRRTTDDGHIASSGIYFCRMVAEGRALVRRLAVVD